MSLPDNTWVTYIAAVAFGFLVALLQTLYSWLRRGKKEETIEERINTLTSSLQEASKVVSEVSEEIEDRQRLARKLQQDIETYNRVVGLKKNEVEAVAQV